MFVCMYTYRFFFSYGTCIRKFRRWLEQPGIGHCGWWILHTQRYFSSLVLDVVVRPLVKSTFLGHVSKQYYYDLLFLEQWRRKKEMNISCIYNYMVHIKEFVLVVSLYKLYRQYSRWLWCYDTNLVIMIELIKLNLFWCNEFAVHVWWFENEKMCYYDKSLHV